MKKVILYLCLFVALFGCKHKIIQKNIEIEDLDFSKKQNYIVENKDKLSNVIMRRQTVGSTECYLLNNNQAYDLFTKINKASDNAIAMTDNYISYTFEFNDDSTIIFSFSGDAYEEGRNSYTLENFKHIKFNEESLQECE